MTVVGAVIKYRGAKPSLPAKQFTPIKKDGFDHIARMWFLDYRPKHFTRAGAREYGYAPRVGELLPRASKAFRRSYYGRKLKKLGHADPLVFSGASKRATAAATIVAFGTGSRIKMPAGNLRWRNKHSKIDMMDEMRRVSASEVQALTEALDKRIQGGLNANRDASQEKIA